MVTGNSCIGQRFRNRETEAIYLLSKVDITPEKVALINLYSGVLWYFPTTVKDVYCISEEEFREIIGSSDNLEVFERIEGKK